MTKRCGAYSVAHLHQGQVDIVLVLLCARLGILLSQSRKANQAKTLILLGTFVSQILALISSSGSRRMAAYAFFVEKSRPSIRKRASRSPEGMKSCNKDMNNYSGGFMFVRTKDIFIAVGFKCLIVLHK